MDFTALNDEQLLELLKETMAEAIRRGGAVAAASQNEVLSAKERAQIEFEVAEKLRAIAAEKERKRIAEETEAKIKAEARAKAAALIESEWAVKAAAVTAIRKWGYKGSFEIAIWSRGADRRVYLQDSNRRQTWKFCLYLTGNDYHPPGELEGTGADCYFDDKQNQLKAFLKAISESWQGDVKIPDDAGDVEPAPKALKKYLKTIGLEVNA